MVPMLYSETTGSRPGSSSSFYMKVAGGQADHSLVEAPQEGYRESGGGGGAGVKGLALMPHSPHRARYAVPACTVAPASARGHPSHSGGLLDGLDSPGGAHPPTETLPGKLSGHGSAKLLCRYQVHP